MELTKIINTVRRKLVNLKIIKVIQNETEKEKDQKK